MLSTTASVLSSTLSRVTVFEQNSQHLLLESNDHAVWVDVSLCLDPAAPNSLPFLRESKSIITVIGYIQVSEVRLASPYSVFLFSPS